MPIAFVREVDARVLDLISPVIGSSARVDRGAALLARHLAKLHVLLLLVMLLGGRGDAGRRRRLAGLRMTAALPVAIGVVSLVGARVRRDRPFTQDSKAPALVEHSPERSFPSRHSACAALMTTIALPSAPRVGGLMALGALGLGASRIYTGLHYPSDVLAGWLIGVGIGIIARRKEPSRVPWK